MRSPNPKTRGLKVGAAPLSEAPIQQCSEWLALDQWWCGETTPVQRGQQIYARPWPRFEKKETLLVPAWQNARCELMFIEWKSLKRTIEQHQREWRSGMRLRGFLIVSANIDFPPTVEGFQDWYQKSGLLWRKIA